MRKINNKSTIHVFIVDGLVQARRVPREVI